MSKPTILFLDQQGWRSGAQRVLDFSLDALSADFDPIVAFPEGGPFVRELGARGFETLRFPLGTYRSGRKSVMDMATFPLRGLICGIMLARLIVRRNVKLVYINGPRCLAAGVLAARITARPSLFHLHLTLNRYAEAVIAGRLARYTSLIIACSEAAAGPLLAVDKSLRRRIHVLYNPLSPPSPSSSEHEAQAKKNPSDFVFGTVGRLTERKGHAILLQAAGHLSPEWKTRVSLVIVGAPAPANKEDAAYLARLKAQASSLKLSRQITWAGYQQDMSPYYASMDALVQPSFDDCGEAMPLAILEALQSGAPVIASRTGGIPEVIRENVNGILVPSADSASLARALERFMSDALLRDRLRSGTRTSVDSRFSPEQFRSALREMVGCLCGDGIISNTAASGVLPVQQ